MAKKKRLKKVTKKKLSIGTLAGFAGVLVLFVSALNPMNAATIAIALLLGFSAYKYISK